MANTQDSTERVQNLLGIREEAVSLVSMTALERVCTACAIIAIAVLVAATLAWGGSTQASIGGHAVPAVACEEDEAIWWAPGLPGQPYHLACVPAGGI